jgi:hypothetical protein
VFSKLNAKTLLRTGNALQNIQRNTELAVAERTDSYRWGRGEPFDNSKIALLHWIEYIWWIEYLD